MAQINVPIAGRTYRIACNDGEEDHLRGLAARLDAKIDELRGAFGEIGDNRITVMAAITMTDLLSEAERRVSTLETEIERLRDVEARYDTQAGALADAIAEALDDTSARIERITQGLNNPGRE